MIKLQRHCASGTVLFVSIVLVLFLFGCSSNEDQTGLPVELTQVTKASRGSKLNRFIYAKKQLLKFFLKSTGRTFYCGCKFKSKKVVNWNSCGYQPKILSSRSKRVEWEHVVPASIFGRKFSEWKIGHSKCRTSEGKKYKGRRCARKANAKFWLMETDLYNFVPTVGEVNKIRSNYKMGIIDGETREFGKCDVEIKNKTIEPRPEVRGNIARIYLYMDGAYPNFGIVNNENKYLLESWDRMDPVNEVECDKARAIYKIQGRKNPILRDRCKKNLL